MKKWEIEYWHGDKNISLIEIFFEHLTKEQFKSVAKELKILELCGNKLRMPHSRSLGKGLFELRERNYGYRIYYMFTDSNTIILLNVGNKKSQKKDIKLARKRLSR